MKRLLTKTLFFSMVLPLFLSINAHAQKASELVYTNVREAIKESTDFTIIGKGFDNQSNDLLFSRLPNDINGKVRQAVWDLGRNSAGIAIRFRTNAECIGAKWTLLNNFSMAHMAGTGIRGIDLYSFDSDKKQWCFVGTAQPNGKESINVFRRNMPSEYRDYLMYLPLYDGVVDLEIGINGNAKFAHPMVPQLLNTNLPIVFYGTSVTQGGCASRPGMAYPAIIERKLNRETINLGFSGNGRMDKVMAQKISTIKAHAYVIDCLANCTYDIIKDSTEYFISTIAKANPNTPVIMVSNYAYPYQWTDEQFRKDLANENSLWLALCKKLQKQGYKNVHFINLSGGKIYPQKGDVKFTDDPKSNLKNLGGNMKKSATGPDNEGTVDGVHLTDLGFIRLANELLKYLK